MSLRIPGFYAACAMIGLSIGCGSESSECASDADCDGTQTCFRSQCLTACDEPSDCAFGETCRDSVCVPSTANSCQSAADCVGPVARCEDVDRAVCSGGRCEYPELICDDPSPPRCSDDGTEIIFFETPGVCTDETGCTYVEQRIPADPADCEVRVAGDCDAVQCPDLDCRTLGAPTGEFCACEYQRVTPAGEPCADGLDALCTDNPTCDGEGNCVGLAFNDDAACVDADENPVEALDDQGRPRSLAEGESAPTPFCLDGSCVECRVETQSLDCDDDDPCTFDRCGSDGRCRYDTEPADGDDCLLAEADPFYGDTGFCRAGACVQCDSTLRDDGVRNAPCIGGPDGSNVCLQGSCAVAEGEGGNELADVCVYDFEGTLGNPCGTDSENVCLQGRCVECFENAQCPEDENACTREGCDMNTNTCFGPTNVETEEMLSCVDPFGGNSSGLCFDGECWDCSSDSPRLPAFEGEAQCYDFVPDLGSPPGQNRCEAVLREGGSCSTGEACQQNERCDSNGVCSGSRIPGCCTRNSQCASNQCRDGECVPVPDPDPDPDPDPGPDPCDGVTCSPGCFCDNGLCQSPTNEICL
ncbi:MAG: hypothetical protein AAFV36_05675 [Myxococcota bacterium]